MLVVVKLKKKTSKTGRLLGVLLNEESGIYVGSIPERVLQQLVKNLTDLGVEYSVFIQNRQGSFGYQKISDISK